MAGATPLPDLLEFLSHSSIITGFGFALAGAIIRFVLPEVATALWLTGSILGMLAVVFWRLSVRGRSQTK